MCAEDAAILWMRESVSRGEGGGCGGCQLLTDSSTSGLSQPLPSSIKLTESYLSELEFETMRRACFGDLAPSSPLAPRARPAQLLRSVQLAQLIEWTTTTMYCVSLWAGKPPTSSGPSPSTTLSTSSSSPSRSSSSIRQSRASQSLQTPQLSLQSPQRTTGDRGSTRRLSCGGVGHRQSWRRMMARGGNWKVAGC